MDTPNLRWNALKLGFSLLWLAANPWSGLTRSGSHAIPWQPEDPFGAPRWWPFAHGAAGRSVDLARLRLMRSALRLPDARSNIPHPNELPVYPARSDLVENKIEP
jgi:hypothetical protein